MATLCFLAFEVGLVIAFVAFFVILTPTWVGMDWELLLDRFIEGNLAPLAYKVWWLLVAGVVILLDPLYVGTGFAVYLNRRTGLEGWDLEIAFRRMARRIRAVRPETEVSRGHRARKRDATSVAAGVLLLLILVAPESVEGTSPPEEGEAVESTVEVPTKGASWHGDPERDPRRVVVEVMKLPELVSEEVKEGWQLREGLF